MERAASMLNSPYCQASGAAEEDSPLFHTDDFRMWCMKVVPCTKRFKHDWSTCPFAHLGEKAARRDPRLYQYTGIACPDMKKTGNCLRSLSCPYAHNVFEYWLHPTRYRTQLCNDGAGCRRPSCFFAHTLDELRLPACKPYVSPEALARASLEAIRANPHPLGAQLPAGWPAAQQGAAPAARQASAERCPAASPRGSPDCGGVLPRRQQGATPRNSWSASDPPSPGQYLRASPPAGAALSSMEGADADAIAGVPRGSFDRRSSYDQRGSFDRLSAGAGVDCVVPEGGSDVPAPQLPYGEAELAQVLAYMELMPQHPTAMVPGPAAAPHLYYGSAAPFLVDPLYHPSNGGLVRHGAGTRAPPGAQGSPLPGGYCGPPQMAEIAWRLHGRGSAGQLASQASVSGGLDAPQSAASARSTRL